MEKKKKRGRTIAFNSAKNGKRIVVSNQDAREYARLLENDSSIVKYDTLVDLDQRLYEHVSSVGIRKEYFKMEWVSDFLLYFENGEKQVSELIFKEALFKSSTIEKLEFSRRYWMNTDVRNWKIVIMEEEVKDVL